MGKESHVDINLFGCGGGVMHKILKAWHMYSPFIHVGVWLVMAGWFGNIVWAYGGRLNKVEESSNDVAGDVREIKESINWIKEALRDRR